MDFELHRGGGPGDRPPIDPEQQRQLDLQRELERQRDQELMRPVIAAQLDEHIGQRPDLQDYLKQFKPEEQDRLKEAVTESLARFAPHAKQIDHIQIGKEDGKLYVLSSKYFMGVADPAKALGISDEERLSLSRPAPTQQDRLVEPSRDQAEPQSRPQPERDIAPRTPEVETPQAGQSEPARYTGPLTLAQRQQQALQNIPLDASQVAEPRFEHGVLAVQPIPYSNPFGPQPISHEPQQRQADIQQQLEPKLNNVLDGYSSTEQQQLKQALTDEISDITGSRLQIDHIERLEDGRISAELNRGLHHVYLDPQQVLQPEPALSRPQEALSIEEQSRRDAQQQIQQQIERLTQHPPFERLAIEHRLREAVGDERIESLRMDGEDTIQLGLRNGLVLTATTYELLNMSNGRELLERAQVDPATQSNQGEDAGKLLIDPNLKGMKLADPIAVLADAGSSTGKLFSPYTSKPAGFFSLSTFEGMKKDVTLAEATGRGQGFRNVTGPAIIAGLAPSLVGLAGSASVPLGIGSSTIAAKGSAALQSSSIANVTVQTIGKHLGRASVKSRITGAGIGMGVNTGVQLATREEGQKLDYGSIAVSGLTGGLSTGASLWGTVAINSGGTFAYQKIKGEEAGPATAASVVGSVVGYGLAKGVVEKSLNPIFNPVRNQYKFIPTNGTNYMHISAPINPLPGMAGSAVSAGSSEFTTYAIQEEMKIEKKNEK